MGFQEAFFFSGELEDAKQTRSTLPTAKIKQPSERSTQFKQKWTFSSTWHGLFSSADFSWCSSSCDVTISLTCSLDCTTTWHCNVNNRGKYMWGISGPLNILSDIRSWVLWLLPLPRKDREQQWLLPMTFQKMLVIISVISLLPHQTRMLQCVSLSHVENCGW